jgi:hypothetical protein
VKLSDMKVNATAIEQGEWIGKAHGLPIPQMGDLALKVRGLGNSDFRALQARLFDEVPRSERPGGKLSAKAADGVMNRCLIETVLQDWAGILGDDDKPLKFSKGEAGKLLADPAFVRFREAVIWASSQVGELRAEDTDALAKN